MLFRRLLKKYRSAGPRIARPARRRLQLEKLLARELLVADFGAISGTVFTDLSGNGLDVADPVIANIPVTLYQDGGDGIFDFGAGGSDDIFLQATNSDVNGEYLFDRLFAGDYFVEQDAVPGRIMRTGASVATVEITDALARGISNTGQLSVDTFDGNLQAVSDPAAGLVNPTNSATAAEAIGGERDLTVTRVSATGTVAISVNGPDGAFMIFEASPTGFGTAEIQWDGADGDTTTIDFTGLAGRDFTTGGAEGLLVDLGASELGSTFALRFYSTAVDFSTFTMALTDSFPALDAFTIGFNDPGWVDSGTGADFANIGAIRGLLTTTVGATDVIIDVVGAIAPGTATANFANFIPITLGNFVFQDNNNNGTVDAGDSGINGVTVSLFEDTNANGVFNSGVDQQVGASTTTAAGGIYQFTNVFPGNYFVQVPQSQFALGNTLSGFQTSQSTVAAADPDNNVNNDDNGNAQPGLGVVSDAITLVSLGEPTDDGDADANTNLTLDFGFTPQIDVQIVKSVLTANPVAGQAATYRLTVTNNSVRTVTNVVATDTLPTGVTNPSVITGQGASVIAGSTITSTIGTMTAGQVVVIDITVDVPADGTGAFTNQSTVTSDGFDTDTNNNSSNVDLDPARIADVQLVKDASVTTALVGDDFFYTITVTNVGPSTATGVTVVDTLPTGVTFDSGTITRGGVTTSTGIAAVGSTVTINVGTMTVSEIVTIRINVLAGPTSAGTSTNTATATLNETDPTNDNTDTASVAISAVVDLVIDKTSPTTATAGGSLTYTFDVRNNGPAAATAVTIVDTLPTGVTFTSGTGGTFDATTPGQVTIDVGALAVGGTATLTMTVSVPAAAAGTLTNTADISSGEIELPATDADNTDAVQTAIVTSVDLSVTKTDSIDPVVPGNQLVYTVTVDNLGVSNATNALLEDTLPAGVTLVSIAENAVDITNTATVVGQIVTLTLGTMAPADPARVFTITTTVAPSVTTTITNDVTIRSDQQATETNLVNNADSETTAVNPTAVLTVVKSDNVVSATPGGTVSYTIQVSNAGPSNATSVVATDTLPAGVNFVSGTAPGGNVTQVGNVLTIPYGTIASGGQASATITVSVGTTTRGTLTNSVVVTGTGATAGTLSDTEDTPLVADFDITVDKTVMVGAGAAGTSGSAVIGDTLTFTITVSNSATSISAATGVTLTDTLPAGISFVSATGPNGAINNLTNIAVGTLEPGASRVFTVIGTVANTAVEGTNLNSPSTVAAEGEPVAAPLPNNDAVAIAIVDANGSIAGRVIVDANNNGVLDAGELGRQGVLISLINATTGAVITTTTTNATGNYSFTDLVAGNYRVTRTLPAGFMDGADELGAGALAGATSGTDSFAITLGVGGNVATDFDFGIQAVVLSKWLFFA